MKARRQPSTVRIDSHSGCSRQLAAEGCGHTERERMVPYERAD